MNRKQRRMEKIKKQGGPVTLGASLGVQGVFADALRHHKAGRLNEAERLYRQILAVDSRHTDSLHLLGAIAFQVGRLDLAVDMISRAIALNAKVDSYHSNLGLALKELGRLDEAIASYLKALALRPDFSEAHNNLGSALQELGRLDEAVACYRRALDIRPENAKFISNLLVTMPFIDTVDADAIQAETRRFGERFEPHGGWGWNAGRVNDPDPERLLRVGYLTPSLSAHVLAPYIEPVFRAHRRDCVSVHVYAQVPRPDAVTLRLKDLADTWTFVHTRSDDEVTDLIASDGIDILVDPMGHWADNRLPVFARKPAPVQVSYLCQGLTTGLTAMDYAIGDRWLNEGGMMQRFATERVVELPSGFQVTAFDQTPPIGEPPCLSNGFVTFGSFNNPAKISDASLDLWARVLMAVPGSHLLIKGKWLDRPETQALLMRRLAARDIAAGRVEIMGWILGAGHMSTHDRIDIMLDTTPFCGGRTTVDALWMGVPVITLVGETVYGRSSYSHLARIGAVELTAHTEAEYIAIAHGLANDLVRQRRYRHALRPALQASSLLDPVQHVAELEAAFRVMWRRRCVGLPPEAFRLVDAPGGAQVGL
jgi:predicted O-linked N-acetylglucosamine transferase (SPINDLY family)